MLVNYEKDIFMGTENVHLISFSGIFENMTYSFEKNVSNNGTISFNDEHLDLFAVITEVETISLVALYLPVFIWGFLGNLSIVFLIGVTPQLRNSTNFYLCNMAIADLLVTLVCIPMAVGQALYRVWIYGEFMCKIMAYLQGVTVAASIYTIATLSIDRFLAIRHPMLFRRFSGSGIAVRFIFVIWLISIGIMIPLLLVRKVQSFGILSENVLFCTENWPEERHRQIYDLALFIVVYIVPGLVISSAYGFIGKELWTEDVNLQRTESEISQGIGKQVMNGRKKVAKMLIALALVFAVCWLPYYIVSLYIDFNYHTSSSKPFMKILPFAIFLGHSNSALNPILYFYSSRSFRKYFVRSVTCKKPTRNFNVRQIPPPIRQERSTAKRAVLRIVSSNTSLTRTRSSGGSFRFSRSSNTSLKSTNTSFRSKDFRSTPESIQLKTRNPESATVKLELEKSNSPNTDVGEKEYLLDCHQDNAHRRNILDMSLSIPTTINEESSRFGAITPTRSHSIVQLRHIPKIPEGLVEDDNGS